MTWLITGGAGYIGAHVVELALMRNFKIAIVDDLSTGSTKRIPENVPFLNASVSDDAVKDFMEEHKISGIVHLAALKNVGESELMPQRYWQTNVTQFERFLGVSRSLGVRHFVFSSSAAVYGQPDVDSISEDTPAMPINNYGKTKLEGEHVLDKFADLSRISLRYFNVAGASSRKLADTQLQNLIPIAIDKIEKGLTMQVYGDTFPTPDGTCIRDYIHVIDIAEAHIQAMGLVSREHVENERINLGTGYGRSVREVITALEEVSGLSLKQVVNPPRSGDPARLVSNPEYAKTRLTWEAKKTFSEIIGDSWIFRG
jgi:UDP-glucose 4-epimerase